MPADILALLVSETTFTLVANPFFFRCLIQSPQQPHCGDFQISTTRGSSDQADGIDSATASRPRK